MKINEPVTIPKNNLLAIVYNLQLIVLREVNAEMTGGAISIYEIRPVWL
jgi:hypothetical protein